jgi:membrane fusion protein (multidrug efflux system)
MFILKWYHMRGFSSAPLLCALIGAGLLTAGCSRREPTKAVPAVEVGVVTLEARRVTLQEELPGRTTVSSVADVRPQVSGIVKARLFEEGSEVKAGRVLYQIDAAAYQAAFDQAAADLAAAEAAVASTQSKDQRYQELLKIQGVSQQEADDARAVYRQALASVALKKAALESARINLNYTQVRAPIAGRIGKSSVTAGALVTANQDTALATIRALDPIYVDLTQSSAQLLQLRNLLGSVDAEPGDTRVRLKLEDGTEYAQTGVLKFHEVSVDQATGSVTLRAQFPNPHEVLLPGMYVRAVLDEAVNRAAVLAPQQAISRDAKGNAVAMVVGKEGRAEQRSVVTGRAIGNSWLILQGLNSGDRLIVEGFDKVHAGDAVRAVAVNIGDSSGARAADLAGSSEPSQARSL